MARLDEWQNGGVTRDPSLRVSDAEREQAAGALRENLAEGRLTLEEFSERLDAAFAAKTYGELDALMIDLPRRYGTEPIMVSDARALLVERWESRRRNRFRRSWTRYLTVVTVCWALWGVTVAASGGHDLEGMWPAWVTLPWGAFILRRPFVRQHHHCSY